MNGSICYVRVDSCNSALDNVLATAWQVLKQEHLLWSFEAQL